MIHRKIESESSDEHVFIHVAYPDGVDDISIDIGNDHGRRYLSVRGDGMGLGGWLIDRAITPDHDETRMRRYCVYCGEAINLVEFRAHVCEAPDDE